MIYADYNSTAPLLKSVKTYLKKRIDKLLKTMDKMPLNGFDLMKEFNLKEGEKSWKDARRNS